jgi:diguanylate cyclase (GGDEF)-like protein/PAS domain S-box-containing protein
MTSVLIVDDQATNRLLLARLASSIESDIQVAVFEDPIGALTECGQRAPDLIISDYKLGPMSGAEFIHRLRAISECHDVPIMVLTAYDERTFRMAALEAGATDFLLSPVDHTEFLSRARNLLQLRKQQKLLESRATVLADELLQSERAREEIVRNDREVLEQVIDTVPAFIMAADRSGRCIFVNSRQARHAGGAPSDYVGQPIGRLLANRAGLALEQDHQIFLSGRAMPSIEEAIIGHDGTRRIFETVKTPLRDALQNIVGVVTISTDITARKVAEEQMTHMAHHDALTGLPNRVLLLDRVQMEIDAARQSGDRFALLFLDLDRFKAVNDGFGHPVGDWLLQEIANRLTENCSAQDMVARLGGDEFAILHVGLGPSGDPAVLADRVVRSVTAPITHKGYPLYTSVSVGVTVFPTDAQDAETLQRNADLAMYQAKADGKNTYRFFHPTLTDKMDSLLQLEAEIREALRLEQFTLRYQPQIDLRNGMICGVEALLRWERPGDGLLLPARFLPVAEESGLIADIGAWVIKTAATHAAAWLRDGGCGLRVAVNVSPSQFLRQDVFALVSQTLDTTGLPTELLDLELTESTLLDDRPRTAEMLHALADRGVQFSIDDFGMGYASLRYFKRVSISRIKIDQSYIRNFPASLEDRAIVDSAIALGRTLGIPVLAEGVETAQELSAVRHVGCDQAQGFYFGKLLTHEQVLPLVHRQKFDWPI